MSQPLLKIGLHTTPPRPSKPEARAPSTAITVSPAVAEQELARFVLEIQGRMRFDHRIPLSRIARLLSQTEATAEDRKELIEPLAAVLPGPNGRSEPLWLAFASPAGMLPAIAWEALLQSDLKRPILRQSYLPFQRPAVPEPLDVLVCASSPVAKESFPLIELIEPLVRQILAGTTGAVCVHLFTDKEIFPALQGRFQQLRAGAEVRVLDPDAMTHSAAPRERSVNDEPGAPNPWLSWMMQAFPEDRAADIVHFVGHGYRSLDQGALAVAESPTSNTDEQCSRFLGPRQLLAFLTQVGAWSAGFSSPAHNYSREGLWLLADNLARILPGPVFVHDLRREHASPEPVTALYRYLYGTGNAAPGSPALCIYTHTVDSALAQKQETALIQHLPSSETVQRLCASRSAPPRWVVASQRYLEREASELSSASGGTSEHCRQGSEAALQFLSTLIAEHAQTAGTRPILTESSEAWQQYADAVERARQGVMALVPVPDSPGNAELVSQAFGVLAHYSSELSNLVRLAGNILDREAMPAEVKETLEKPLHTLERCCQAVEAMRQEVGQALHHVGRLRSREQGSETSAEEHDTVRRRLETTWEMVAVAFGGQANSAARAIRKIGDRLRGGAARSSADAGAHSGLREGEARA